MTKPTFDEEKRLWRNGILNVVGVDEVGRGAFAGPVVTAAVVFAPDCIDLPGSHFLKEINDSKLLSAKKREILSKEIIQNCVYSVIASASVTTINKIGIHKATFQAFRKSLQEVLRKFPFETTYVLADGFHIPHVKQLGIIRQKAIIKGDRKSISIAAASIVAKVYRDTLMSDLHDLYAAYNFRENKGYGTKEHQNMISRYGLSKLHRTSFNLTKFLPDSR